MMSKYIALMEYIVEVEPQPVDKVYKETCIKLFNEPFEKYKSITAKKTNQLNEVVPDYVLYEKIQTGFEVLTGLIKYAIFLDASKWEINSKLGDPTTLQIKFPTNMDELFKIYNRYPAAIICEPELGNIIQMEGLELLLKINSINRFLYFSTFSEDGTMIMEAENDTELFWIQIKKLVKKLLKQHIKLAKNKTF